MKIALVEDHLMTRDVLRRACEHDFGHEIVGEVEHGADALTMIATALPEVLILDLQLPDRNGLDVLADVRLRYPLLRVMILSARCDHYTVYRVEQARVSGFVDKNSHTVAMIGEALQALAKGGAYFSPAFVRLKAARRKDQASFDKLLSEREQMVLIALSEFLPDREVAIRLGIAPATVEKHRFNMLRKLNLATTAELVRYARTQGFYPGMLAPA